MNIPNEYRRINTIRSVEDRFSCRRLSREFDKLKLSKENVDKLITIGPKIENSAYFQELYQWPNTREKFYRKLSVAFRLNNNNDKVATYSEKIRKLSIDTIDDANMRSLYEKLNNLDLSEENNAREVIDLGLRFMDTTCFSRCTKNIKDNVHEKLGHAYWKINKYDDAIEYFKRNGKLNQKEIDEIIRDKEMIESLYNKLNSLELSENNVQKVIDLSLEFMDSPCFSRCIEDIKRNVYEKLGHAYQMKKEYVDAVVYFKRNGKLNQKEIDEITHDKEKFDKYLEEIDPAEMTSEKFELLFNRFSELKLSEENVDKLINIGLKFIQNPVFESQYANKFKDIYSKLGRVYYELNNDGRTALVYLQQSGKIYEDEELMAIYNKIVNELQKYNTSQPKSNIPMQNKIANEPQKYNTPPPKSNVLMHDKVVDKLQEECKKHNCIAKCEKAPTTIINKEVSISYKKSPEELENEAKAFYQQLTSEESAKNEQLKKLLFNNQLEELNQLIKEINQLVKKINQLEKLNQLKELAEKWEANWVNWYYQGMMTLYQGNTLH